MASMEERNRWICPTDRELKLRAKLNSGWSVHSQDHFRRGERILDTELRSVENVIKRSKIIDVVEKERIQKLVWRLENMRRNVVGDGKRNCSMCGIAFGIFRLSLSHCTDCLKAVCEKCRIDIHNSMQEIYVLCKICSENREVWKKSGGWFYGIDLFGGEITFQCEKITENASSKCGAIFTDTWEHKKPDIVRLESFEPPEENHNEHTLYKNWAVNSTPELRISFDEPPVENATEMKNLASSNESLDMSALSPPEETIFKLSSSCPSLQENIPRYRKAIAQGKRHKHLLSTKITRKVAEKFSRHKS